MAIALPLRPRSSRGAAPTGPAVPSSLAGLVARRALGQGARPFLIGARDSRSLSFGDLASGVERARRLLDRLDLPPDEPVGLCVAEPVLCASALVCLLAAGRTVAPLDHGAPDAELRTAIRRSAATVVLADRPPPKRTGADGGAPDRVDPSCRAHPSGWIDPSSWIDAAELWPAEPPNASVGSPPIRRAPARSGSGARGGGHGAILLATSGTTGAPKRIRLTEDQLLHVASEVVVRHRLGGDDRCFNPLPLFHVNAEVVAVLASLVSGGSVVLADRFHRKGFWSAVQAHGATWVNAVPAIVARLAVLADDESVPPRVRFVRSASAPLPVPVLQRFTAVTGLPVVLSYGMTEAASQITVNLETDRRPGSVGRPAGVELRVVCPPEPGGSPRPGPPGAAGRVQIRGPGVIRAYEGGAGGRIDADGWLTTGDLGWLDEDGYLFLTGREDDMINRSGEKIAPLEVETVLARDPAVRQVVVAARPDPVLGEVPVAYVVLQDPAPACGGRRAAEPGHRRSTGAERTPPGGSENAAAVVARLAQRCARELAHPKRPAAFHVVESLPSGATGKVRRRALEDQPVLASFPG